MISVFEGPKKLSSKGSRVTRVFFVVLAVAFNLVLLLGAGLYLMDDDDYRRLLVWSADEFLDSQLEIDGAFSVRIGNEVELTAEKVRLKARDGSYDLSAGKLNIEQRFGSYLWTGRLWINHLRMDDVTGEIIETAAAQEFNWGDFSVPFLVIEEVQLNRLSLTYTEIDKQQHTIALSQVLIDDTDNQGPVKVSATGEINARPLVLDGTLGTLRQMRNADQAYPIELTLSSRAADTRADKTIVEVSGLVGRTPSDDVQVQASFDVALPELVPIFSQAIMPDRLGHLQGSVTIADADDRWRINKLQVAAIDTDLYQLRIDGEIDDSGNLDLRSEIQVPDPQALGAQFDFDLTGYGPYKGQGQLTGNRDSLNYQGHTSIGRIQNDTTLSISLVEGKPFLEGKFIIPELYLPDIGLTRRLGIETEDSVKEAPDTGKQSKAGDSNDGIDDTEQTRPDANEGGEPDSTVPVSTDSKPVFDREPLDFSGLQHFNMDLEILIDQITGIDYAIGQLAGRIKLTDGVLQVSPMRLAFEGGSTDLDLELSTRGTPSIDLKLTADDLVLGKMIARVQNEVLVKGKAHLNVDIDSKGHSAHELASQLAGEVSFSLENARLPRSHLEFLSADIHGFLWRTATFSDSYTTLSCVMTSFDIDQGIARSTLLHADGPHLSIDGTATLDLGQETIDLVLLPEQKQRLRKDTGALTVNGPLNNPQVETSTGGAVAATVGGVILIPEIIVPVFLVEQVWKLVTSDDDTGCTEYLEAHNIDQ